MSPALGNIPASLAIFSVPGVDHDDMQLSLSSALELTLTSLACGSLAGPFKTVIIVYWSIYGSLLSFWLHHFLSLLLVNTRGCCLL